MSSTALEPGLCIALFALASGAALAKQGPRNLSCEQQDASAEPAALKLAPSGARRIDVHVLEVGSKKATRQFIDKPPHDEGGMGGVHWRYCGFDPKAKAHLIEMTDNGLFSGDLFFEESGVLLRAGHTVVFAQDQKDFLAIEQEDGVDGANWSVYDGSGKILWKGYAGAIQKVDGIDSVKSTFDRPRWNKRGELTARFACTASKVRGIVTLSQSPSGSWTWHGLDKC
jgi:hypothetical protein